MRAPWIVTAILVWAVSCAAQTAPQPPALPDKPQPTTAAQQGQGIDPVKEADIRQLLELTGAKKIGDQFLSYMLQQLRPSLEKAVPQNERGRKIISDFLTKFETRFHAADTIGPLVLLYDKYLTGEDIKGLIEFYQTPLGRKAIEVLPKITQESALAGQQISQKVLQEVMKEMEEEYPELRQQPSEPPAEKP